MPSRADDVTNGATWLGFWRLVIVAAQSEVSRSYPFFYSDGGRDVGRGGGVPPWDCVPPEGACHPAAQQASRLLGFTEEEFMKTLELGEK